MLAVILPGSLCAVVKIQKLVIGRGTELESHLPAEGASFHDDIAVSRYAWLANRFHTYQEA